MMKKVATGVYIENTYAGVTLGALVFKEGIVMIDAPISPEDGRAWQQALRKLDGGTGRLLINLDSHPDRTLGVRTMESYVLAHKASADSFTQRPTIFKAQGTESGAEWENTKGLSGIRWQPPNLVFTDRVRIHWGDTEVLIEHHPGPAKGACWVLLPEKKVVFVGDAVVARQPPFLADANLGKWVEALDVLLSKYKGFKIISGRGGQVGEKDIRSLSLFIKDVDKQLNRITKRKGSPQAAEKLAEKLLPALESPAKYRKFYMQRLQHGLYHYYARNYYASSSK
jgi:glyoxylase-like metal-dependent hydrolase (beta-lactamase superfamily II)